MTLLTTTETAGRFRLSPSKVRQLAKKYKNELCVSFGEKSNRIIAENFEKFIIRNIGKDLLA